MLAQRGPGCKRLGGQTPLQSRALDSGAHKRLSHSNLSPLFCFMRISHFYSCPFSLCYASSPPFAVFLPLFLTDSLLCSFSTLTLSLTFSFKVCLSFFISNLLSDSPFFPLSPVSLLLLCFSSSLPCSLLCVIVYFDLLFLSLFRSDLPYSLTLHPPISLFLSSHRALLLCPVCPVSAVLSSVYAGVGAP